MKINADTAVNAETHHQTPYTHTEDPQFNSRQQVIYRPASLATVLYNSLAFVHEIHTYIYTFQCNTYMAKNPIQVVMKPSTVPEHVPATRDIYTTGKLISTTTELRKHLKLDKSAYTCFVQTPVGSCLQIRMCCIIISIHSSSTQSHNYNTA